MADKPAGGATLTPYDKRWINDLNSIAPAAHGGMRDSRVMVRFERMDDQVRGPSRDFRIASGEAAQPVLVPIEPDLAAWFCDQGDLVREINTLCRFYMDTSIARELDFANAAEQVPPDTAKEAPSP